MIDITILAYEKITDKYSKAKYGDFDVIMDMTTGYINATKLAKDGGRNLFKWIENSASKRLIEVFEENINDSLRNRREVAISVKNSTKSLHKVLTGANDLRGTYVHPKLITHIASWVSPQFAWKVSEIVNNFLVKEKESEIRKLQGEKSELAKMFEAAEKRREEAEKRAEKILLEMKQQNEKTHAKLDESHAKLDETNTKLDETNTKLDETKTKLDESHTKLDETKTKLDESHIKLDESHIKLDETNTKLDETNTKLDKTNNKLNKTHITLKKTKKTLQQVEIRVDALVKHVVPPSEQKLLHESFHMMKLNDDNEEFQYKVICTQKRSVEQAKRKMLKQFPNAEVLFEKKPSPNAKNFLHTLKELFGSGKDKKIKVTYNFISLQKNVTEKDLLNMLQEVEKKSETFASPEDDIVEIA
jgi:hypothetical protein